jgi:hypothetical protein
VARGDPQVACMERFLPLRRAVYAVRRRMSVMADTLMT